LWNRVFSGSVSICGQTPRAGALPGKESK
jgi:hypothetical protein